MRNNKMIDLVDMERNWGLLTRDLLSRESILKRSFVKTFPDAILGSLGPDLWRFIKTWILRQNPAKGAPLRTLINDFTGVVRGGEVNHPKVRLIVDDDGVGKAWKWM